MARSVLECATFEEINSLLSYDPETGVLWWKVTPNNRTQSGCEAGSLHRTGYIHIGIDGKIYLAHQVAHLLMTGQWPEGNQEHENHIRHDNRWSNIKDLATLSQNGGNRSLSNRNTSGLKGVSWDNVKRKWLSKIGFREKRITLGRFGILRDAGLIYDAAAKLAWGSRFASLNFPSEDSDNILLPGRVIRLIAAVR